MLHAWPCTAGLHPLLQCDETITGAAIWKKSSIFNIFCFSRWTKIKINSQNWSKIGQQLSKSWKEVMYFFYVLIYLKFTPLKTWFLNFSFHQYSLFYLYFLKTEAFGNLSKKMCLGGLDRVIFDTFFWQATGSLRYTTGCLCTQQEAGA